MSGEPGAGFEEIPRLGAMLGRYRLDAVIGRGAMGVVFRAVDERLDRAVAIKVLAPDLASDSLVRERFLREARLAAAIEHPHIVPVYEAATAAGVDYIAMRFIPGPDLSRILRREAPLDPVRILAIGGQLADALDAAHARGLIHRDVKPGNVLLEGAGEWVWLTDFGLTKRLSGSLQPTREGLVGTIEYMAPEAIEHGVVDGRSDQYALACLVYHCLAGTPPFEADTEARVLRGHLQEDPPPIGGRNERVPTGIDAVLRRALAKDPADRFPSCGAFAAELRRVAEASGGLAYTPAIAALTGPAGGAARASPPSSGRSRELIPATLTHRRYLVGALVLAGAVVGSMYLANGLGRGSRDPGSRPTDAALAAGPTPPGSGPAGPLASGSAAPASGSAALDTAPAALDTGPLVRAAGLTGPDGVIVFAGDKAGTFDIWAVRPDGSGLTQITRGPGSERAPSASADGSRIVYTFGPNGARDLYMVNADGSGRTRLTTWSGDDYAPAISPDGRSVVWVSDHLGHQHLWLMTDKGHGFDQDHAEDITDDPRTDSNHENDNPTWFPDSRRIAFQSNRGDSPDIWSANVRSEWLTHQWTTDLRRDFQPTVAPDETIAFVREMALGGDRFLFTVTAAEPNPQALTKAVPNPIHADYSPDGSGLVMARDTGSGLGLLTMAADGTHRRAITLKGMPDAIDPDWVEALKMP
jgi:serine/threonine-protein kinase